MRVIYVRQYSSIEGNKFWKKYSLIGIYSWTEESSLSFSNDLYSHIKKDEYKKFKDGIKIEIKGERFLLKIIPKVHTYISNNDYIPKVKIVVDSFVNYDINSTVFFTLKGYSEFLKEQVNAFNLFKYKRYTFQPQENEYEYSRIFPNLKGIPDKYSMLANKSDSLGVLYPPIRISTFDNIPKYKKNKIMKNRTGLSSLEPTLEYKRKIIKPIFLNPTYITVEYSPYLEDENLYLDKLLKFFKVYQTNKNLYKNDIIDVVNYIELLITKKESKRSKLDCLVDFIRIHKENIYSLKLSRFIYKYNIVPKNAKSDNGLYIVRKNGKFSDFIYFIKFDNIEFWVLDGYTGFFDIKKIFNYRNKNLYFYSNEEEDHKKLNKKFLIIKETINKIIMEASDTQEGNILKKIKISGLKNFKIIKTFFIIKKTIYDSEHVMMDIKYQNKYLIGTVRCKGKKIINIIKRL